MTRIDKLTSDDLKTSICHWPAQCGQTFIWNKLVTESATEASKVRILASTYQNFCTQLSGAEVNELNRKPFNIPQIMPMTPLVTSCSMGAAWTEAQKVPGFKAIQMTPWLSLLLGFMGVICHELQFVVCNH